MTDKIEISIMVFLSAEPVASSDVCPNNDEEKYAAEDDPDIPHGIGPFFLSGFLVRATLELNLLTVNAAGYF
jgi:hypothetical protein